MIQRSIEEIHALIRDVPDFPKPGIIFKDITPMLQDGPAFRSVIEHLAERVASEIKYIAGPEARGFLFGPSLAHAIGAGFIPIRKPGKLPYDISSVTYQLEYGEDTIAMYKDAVGPGDRVLLVDDVLATGGTMAACAQLIEEAGGIVLGCHFVMELTFLSGRERIKNYSVDSLIRT